MSRPQTILIGGAHTFGNRLGLLLAEGGHDVVWVDRAPPSCTDPLPAWLPYEALSDIPDLPPGTVVLLWGADDPEPRWAWSHVLNVAITTARLVPALRDRHVIVVQPPGNRDENEVEIPHAALAQWCDAVMELAAEPCPPWRVARLCRELIASVVPSTTGGSVAKAVHQAQTALLDRASAASLEIIRQPDDEFALDAVATALGQMRVTDAATHTPASWDEPTFHPPVEVVIPPRPVLPDHIAARQQAAMWSGALKSGNLWSSQLTEELRRELDLGDDYDVLATTSGTVALQLAIVAAAGVARPGDVALLPSFTFRATADALVRLGYELRYVDVDPRGWTLDHTAVAHMLQDERVAVMVCVDTFGNPCSYDELRRVCTERGIPLVADSAAGFGSEYKSRPVGQQADAHAFSMSFAKVLTAAGAGGAVTFRRDRDLDLSCWLGSALMNEVHAIAALDQLAVLSTLVAIRNEVAAAYESVVADLPGYTFQYVAPTDRHSYAHWVAQVPNRTLLAEQLQTLGVLTKPYFPAQHLHHSVRNVDAVLPVTSRLDTTALALPTSSELSRRQISQLRSAFERAIAKCAIHERWSVDEAV